MPEGARVTVESELVDGIPAVHITARGADGFVDWQATTEGARDLALGLLEAATAAELDRVITGVLLARGLEAVTVQAFLDSIREAREAE